MTTETQTIQTAPTPAAEPWTKGKFLLSIDHITLAGKKAKAAMVYRILAVEAGRLVGQFVGADGTVAFTGFPLCFVPIEEPTNSIAAGKNGWRVFANYKAATEFAKTSKAFLYDDVYSDEEKADMVAISRGEKAAVSNDNTRRRRNA